MSPGKSSSMREPRGSKLLAESKVRLEDRVQRSYGILSHAMIMDSKEAAQRLSDVRLGDRSGSDSGRIAASA